MPGKRVSKVEVSKRIDKVYSFIVGENPPNVIWQWVTDKSGWNVSERTFWRYYKQASDRLGEAAKFERENELGRAIRRLNTLYQHAFRDKDYRACRLIQKDLSELLSLQVKGEEVETGDIPEVSLIIDGKPVEIQDDPR